MSRMPFSIILNYFIFAMHIMPFTALMNILDLSLFDIALLYCCSFYFILVCYPVHTVLGSMMGVSSFLLFCNFLRYFSHILSKLAHSGSALALVFIPSFLSIVVKYSPTISVKDRTAIFCSFVFVGPVLSIYPSVLLFL